MAYLRGFTSSGGAPIPVGFAVDGHEHPITLDAMRGRFPPEAQHCTMQSAIRSLFLIVFGSDLVSRFDEELRQISAPMQNDDDEIIETPAEVTPDSPPEFISASSTFALFSSALSSCSVDLRSGHTQDSMVGRLKRAMSVGKIEISASTVAESTRSRYKAGWAAWRDFCPGLGISPKLDPSVPGAG